MTAALAHRAGQRHPLRRRGLLLLVGAVLAGSAGLATLSPARDDPAPAAVTDSRPLAPREARLLVAATSGEQAEAVQALGEEAQRINAALAFSTAPVEASRPFAIGGDTLDYRRALLCLTQAVYYEAGYEPLAGRRAVAQVVLNRMRHPAFPKSVCGVVYQGARSPVCQFSFVCDGSLDRRPAAGAWDQARRIAAAALAGHVEASVGGATHYHADYVAPRWAPMLTKISRLGAHIFYRWPGAWGRPAAFTGRYAGEAADAATLRPVAVAGATGVVGEAGTMAEVAGPPVARAANDVGGLLDTSKGWTLSIPTPGESSGASRAIAEQQAASHGGAAPTSVLAAR